VIGAPEADFYTHAVQGTATTLSAPHIPGHPRHQEVAAREARLQLDILPEHLLPELLQKGL
jgi:hypothetical protein